MWEHQSLLWEDEGAMLPMRRFLVRMLADKQVPMPGDVQLLTGGPPCQVRRLRGIRLFEFMRFEVYEA
jgi:hypothetical protein